MPGRIITDEGRLGLEAGESTTIEEGLLRNSSLQQFLARCVEVSVQDGEEGERFRVDDLGLVTCRSASDSIVSTPPSHTVAFFLLRQTGGQSGELPMRGK